MEYLILASNFNRFAGPNNPLLDLCNYLYRNIKVDLALLTHDTTFEETFLKSINFPLLRRLKGARSKPSIRFAYTPTDTNIIRRTIRDLSPERVFVNSNIDTLFQTYLAIHRRVKTGYNVFFNRPHTKRVLSLRGVCDHIIARSSVSRVLAHTKSQKSMYTKIGIKDEKVTVIPHCIDAKRIYNSLNDGAYRNRYFRVAPSKIPVIFYGGYLGHHKGIIELVRAYEYVVNKVPVTLILRANGPLKGWVLAQKKKIQNRYRSAKIVVLPWQSPPRFFYLMANATIFVLPSHNEPFGIVLLEAMSLKKPVVATCSGGPSEIITDHVDGLLVNPRDTLELANAFLELLSDSRMRARIGLNAFKTVSRKYDVSKVAPKFIKFMEEED